MHHLAILPAMLTAAGACFTGLAALIQALRGARRLPGRRRSDSRRPLAMSASGEQGGGCRSPRIVSASDYR